MDINKLKRFATEARNILLNGVKQRLAAIGFKPDGTVTEMPQLLGGGAVFMEDVQSEDFYHKWMSLYQRMQSHSFREVAEEAAYTWFNRLVAIRIMAKNGLISDVLKYESEDVHVPVIVTEARQGRMPQMDEASRQKLDALLLNDSWTGKQFALLIVAYCHSIPIIQKCFGYISDYTELLLPGNILNNEGFITRLNDDDYLSDEDYRSPELIGWLYQFYISERKDEVYSKKGKFETDEIPVATQIFTPNWIVKYMVQNTVGRIYLDNNPYSDIKQDMKYLVEPANYTPADAIYQFDDIHELKIADLACGSGHILNECFDLLYQIYLEEGYSRRRAIEDIFRYNLTGIDIDTRAKQLAMFALLLKACQKDASFVDGHVLPNILDTPTTALSLPADSRLANEIEAVNRLLAAANTLGSIIKFNLSQAAYDWVASLKDKNDAARLVLALTKKYSVLVMNPPYMGSGNMNATLSNYVKKNYETGKADLFAVFMLVAAERLADKGKYGMINMQSWMFLSPFEKLRTHILDTLQIDNMQHLGPRTFDELSGEVVQNTAFVLTKHTPYAEGTYYRLVDGKSCGDKELMFLVKENCYPHVFQQNFEKIPGCPIGYWVSEKILSLFNLPLLGDIGLSRQGLATGDNARFLRMWFEVCLTKTKFDAKSNDDALDSKYKWFPHNKGGNVKWYGANDYVIAFDQNNFDALLQMGNHLPSRQFYFKSCISWSVISSTRTTFRYIPYGFTFNMCGMSYFSNNENDTFRILGYTNSSIFNKLAAIINPTINLSNGDFARIPFCNSNDEVTKLVEYNIAISKSDWDAHETSWDFQENELVRLSKQRLWQITATINGEIAQQYYSLEFLVAEYKMHWAEQFHNLHQNEEELNRQFIEIYGLQDELTPDVPLDEITILQQGEISIENGQIVWHDDVIVKQLISYAVGCMMGRYSIDLTGLILANQGDGLSEYESLVPNSRFTIDDDGIIPLMSINKELSDNIALRFKTWLSITFGEENLMENLNFVERALDKRLEDYFLKDFWKDHKKMYQNRPIYWLFSSKRGAFQCIVYMHRMNAYTAERVRTKYLLPHIEWLMTKQAEMQANAANLSARERKELDNIGKQIDECREYHDRLHEVADQQIAFDLDDGVLVNYAKFGDVLAKLK